MNNVADDIKGLFPVMNPSRRGFVVTTIAAGFALSVKPAHATIVTDANGLTAGAVQIPVADGQMPAYRAAPASPGLPPVVIVIEEVFGVHEHIQDICRRFAKQGYLAVAPELFARYGDVVHMSDFKDVMAVVEKTPDATCYSDIDSALAWAAKNGGDLKRAGIVGFCRGGRMVWLYAERNPKLKAGVAWYGPLVQNPNRPVNPLSPASPIDKAQDLTVPVLGLYGGKDQGITADNVDAMRAKLKMGKSGSEIQVYPDAEHGFNADYRPSYNPDAAADGWKRALAWLHDHGVA